MTEKSLVDKLAEQAYATVRGGHKPRLGDPMPPAWPDVDSFTRALVVKAVEAGAGCGDEVLMEIAGRHRNEYECSYCGATSPTTHADPCPMRPRRHPQFQ